MYLLYSLLLLLFLSLTLLISLLKDPSFRKYRHRLGDRFALYPPGLREGLKGSRPLWIHAVSMGEMMAATPLIRELMRQKPGERVILSTVTATGNRLAIERFPEAGAIIFFPIDFRTLVRRSLGCLRPRLVLLTETELWPHFLRACGEQKIPCILINGRISESSFRRYRWVRPFFRRMVGDMPLFCMQGEDDLSRLVALGADPSRVRRTGNLKFDQFVYEEGEDPRPRLIQELSIEEGTPVFVAGSTHPGEEEAAIAAYLRAKGEAPNLVLILAPRHPERFADVERFLRQRGLLFSRRSLLGSGGERQGDIILLDTMGELGRVYSLGTVTFVGGSLVPLGGHNILEPAFYGRPVLFGPHMQNFREIAGLFRAGGGGQQVKDGGELGEKLARLLRHPGEGEAMGERGRSLLREHRGATQRTLDLLKEYL